MQQGHRNTEENSEVDKGPSFHARTSALDLLYVLSVALCWLLPCFDSYCKTGDKSAQ